MIKALIHGKLSRDQENMEDILTSNVFGSLELCRANDLLIAFLQRARTPSGRCLLEGSDGVTKVEYEFWPRYPDCDEAHFCEPDLELRIFFQNGSKHLLFVEAKFLSGKSSVDDIGDEPMDQDRESAPLPETTRSKDQLAKQWTQLERRVSGRSGSRRWFT